MQEVNSAGEPEISRRRVRDHRLMKDRCLLGSWWTFLACVYACMGDHLVANVYWNSCNRHGSQKHRRGPKFEQGVFDRCARSMSVAYRPDCNASSRLRGPEREHEICSICSRREREREIETHHATVHTEALGDENIFLLGLLTL